MNNTPREIIELFHLLFLRYLEGRLDKKLYALKGGCNLRFFFKSIRYSEDIDLDIHTIAVTTLRKKVNKILEGADFRKILQSYGIEIIQLNAVKQTETTQRWKLALRAKGLSIAIPTKIEFSRRKMDADVSYAAIDSELLAHYRLYPILCNHYNHGAACLQKIYALLHRTETQARDIFDLKLLFDQKMDLTSLQHLSPIEISNAINNIQTINYDDFKGHVVAYLMEEYQSLYDSIEQWEAIKTQIISALNELQQ